MMEWERDDVSLASVLEVVRSAMASSTHCSVSAAVETGTCQAYGVRVCACVCVCVCVCVCARVE